jgi:hypothetical protein
VPLRNGEILVAPPAVVLSGMLDDGAVGAAPGARGRERRDLAHVGHGRPATPGGQLNRRLPLWVPG